MNIKSLAKNKIKSSFVNRYRKKPFFIDHLMLSAFSVNNNKIVRVEIRLEGDTALGKRGDIIVMPLDNIIMPQVMAHGNWEPDVLSQIVRLCKLDQTYDLIDVGANCGLMSRQMILSGLKINHVLCVEADKDNAECQRKNLQEFDRIKIDNVGLGNKFETVNFLKMK